ncbi:2-deoxystreptamine glucosyltransferase [Luteitalea pratensis]|uniref:2-deoxystreptamine glucosyltransferase n=1 Tax=Luteitalea pratensis TaxID=1855912 RepID=A0A143PQ93_LUTPR|nr:glycosyltransferase family 1 protein [Luteitalea pratensis]AMY10601.1 2-deoxystreptamine glucosyltransferase [Luteitalea pratensis]
MRIGVDARELGGRPTGVGRYLRELLVRWQSDAACGGHELVMFTPRPGQDIWTTPKGRGARLSWHLVPGAGGTLWQQRDLARAAGAARLDVLFSPAYTAPLLVSIPSVVAQHDVSFAAHPEWYAWRHGLRLRWLARWSGRRAHTVLTLTQFSADQIEHYLGVARQRIRVIPLAVDYHDAASHAATAAPATPVVLFVGSIFERRHLPTLIEGVALARQTIPDLRLYVIGENRTEPRQDLEAIARACGAAEALHVRDYVPDAELEAAYASAGVFAFLSEYEGFGLTPLEAMRHRIPTVVLDTPVAREVYGGGARYVPAGDVNAVATALVELLRDPARRASQIAAGDAAVGRYRWHDAAAATWEALMAAGEPRP